MSIPVGTVAAVSVLPPDGVLLVDGQTWLGCDGRSVPVTQYSALHTVIGGMFGYEDAQSFNLPDLRGRFIRGVNHGNGRDPDVDTRVPMASGGLSGDAVGSVQGDEIASHQHHLTGTWGTGSESDKMAKTSAQGPDDAGSTQPDGASDTRPDNAAVCFVVLASDPQGRAGAPVGSVLAYGGNNDPAPDDTTWLLCDGRTVPRATFPAAYAVFGDAFGSGDGSTTFNLPDLQGRFVRGRDGGANRDPEAAGRAAMAPGGATGDAVGSIQDHSFANHAHHILGTSDQVEHDGGADLQVKSDDPGSGGDAGLTELTGGRETRPKNAYLNYAIRVG